MTAATNLIFLDKNILCTLLGLTFGRALSLSHTFTFTFTLTLSLPLSRSM
jgi:hypothetical protein